MSHELTDEQLVERTRNVARSCVENPQVTWVLLVLTFLWGFVGYTQMPQRKDPDIPVRKAIVVVPWGGNSARDVEQQVVRPIEDAVSGNSYVKTVTSHCQTGLALIEIELDDTLADTLEQFNDLGARLDTVDLPPGAGPIHYQDDFGDTTALMLTVASPPFSPREVAMRARPIAEDLARLRAARTPPAGHTQVTTVVCFPPGLSLDQGRSVAEMMAREAERAGILRQPRIHFGLGYGALDGFTPRPQADVERFVQAFIEQRLQASEVNPNVWPPVVVADPAELEGKLQKVAPPKYSDAELEQFTRLLQDVLRGVDDAAKVDRTAVVQQTVYLLYNQERLASYGLDSGKLSDALQARNIPAAGGQQEETGRLVRLNVTGEFKSTKEIGELMVATASGSPVYLRDLVDIVSTVKAPPSLVNFLTWRDEEGRWLRGRAITVSVYLRDGRQIAEFGKQVDAALADARKLLPADLVVRKTSDQPLQVKENLALFNRSLVEAVVLVVAVSLLGFWEWRSALLMAVAIPITLAMTFGMMWVCRIDLQQVSVASLIIALGLLVDDPVVAGDSIKRSMAAGWARPVAAWLGPTRLAHAIMYATVTNICAYLPFLLLTGDTGRFIYSLPVVVSCSLIASRLSSMTFIPLLGAKLLEPVPEPDLAERRVKGFTGAYYRAATWAMRRREVVALVSLVVLGGGVWCFAQLPKQFFPQDLQYYSYVDVFLPEDSSLDASQRAAFQVDEIIRETAGELGPSLGAKEPILQNVTIFVGGGGPRFWFSITKQTSQVNYAQVIIQVTDKEYTPHLAAAVQQKLDDRLAGVRCDVRQLSTGTPIDLPVALRFTSEDHRILEDLGEKGMAILRAAPASARVRKDWGDPRLVMNAEVDPDMANLVGVTNYDVARSIGAAINGNQVDEMRKGDLQIPIVVRMEMQERAELGDLRKLYVASSSQGGGIPLEQVARVTMDMEPSVIMRRDYQPTVTVGCFAEGNALPSLVFDQAWPGFKKLQEQLPEGVSMSVSGEKYHQDQGFRNLGGVLVVSMTLIYLALTFQFNSSVKPLLVFAAIPYGFSGAVFGLWVMGAPFSFMAFLGIVSLVGVIVSHVIVLFDYIEEMHAKGEPFDLAVVDAGIVRLRPVFITVGATVTALFPLAWEGGPLWQPLCYAQIGGLLIATVVTLIMVPVLYSVAVKDLKWIPWAGKISADDP